MKKEKHQRSENSFLLSGSFTLKGFDQTPLSYSCVLSKICFECVLVTKIDFVFLLCYRAQTGFFWLTRKFPL